MFVFVGSVSGVEGRAVGFLWTPLELPVGHMDQKSEILPTAQLLVAHDLRRLHVHVHGHAHAHVHVHGHGQVDEQLELHLQ